MTVTVIPRRPKLSVEVFYTGLLRSTALKRSMAVSGTLRSRNQRSVNKHSDTNEYSHVKCERIVAYIALKSANCVSHAFYSNVPEDSIPSPDSAWDDRSTHDVTLVNFVLGTLLLSDDVVVAQLPLKMSKFPESLNLNCFSTKKRADGSCVKCAQHEKSLNVKNVLLHQLLIIVLMCT